LNDRTRAARVPHASGILTSSLDYDATLRQVARLPIPGLADWSVVYVPHDGDARVGRMVVAHSRATAQRKLQTLWQREPLELPRQHPLADCLRTRSPLAFSDCPPDALLNFTWRAADAEVLQTVGMRSLMAVPLIAHGVLLGGMMLVGARVNRRPYADHELQPVVELAGGYAHAIYNAQLFWEASLAIQVRDELMDTASRGLLELVQGIRRRSALLAEARQMADPAARRRRTNRAVFEIDLILARMQRLIVELRTAASS
jgi:GAF domain-containing protein